MASAEYQAMSDDMYMLSYEEPMCCDGLWRQVDKMGIKLYTMQGRVGVCVMCWFVLAIISSVVTVSALYIRMTQTDLELVLSSVALASFLITAVLLCAQAAPVISDEEAEKQKQLAKDRRQADIAGDSTEEACVTSCPCWVGLVGVVLVVLAVDGVLVCFPSMKDDLQKVTLITFLSINGMIILAWISSKVNQCMARKIEDDQARFGTRCERIACAIIVLVAVLLFVGGFYLLFADIPALNHSHVHGGSDTTGNNDLQTFFIAFLVCELVLGLVVLVVSRVMIGAVNFGVVHLGSGRRTSAVVRGDDIYRADSKRKEAAASA
jgi:uncharacterized membrane protein YjgN (DUF898 family)